MKDPSRKEPFRRSRLTEERRSTRASLTRPTLFGGDSRSPLAVSPAGQRARVFRIAGGIAALLALGVLGLVLLRTWSVPPAAPAPVAVLEIAHGPVTTLAASTGQDHSRLLALGAGEPVYAGAVVETRAASNRVAPDRNASGPAAPGRAALRLAGGPSLRLDADSRVRIPSSSVVELERGAVYVDFAAAGSDGMGDFPLYHFCNID